MLDQLGKKLEQLSKQKRQCDRSEGDCRIISYCPLAKRLI